VSFDSCANRRARASACSVCRCRIGDAASSFSAKRPAAVSIFSGFGWCMTIAVFVVPPARIRGEHGQLLLGALSVYGGLLRIGARRSAHVSMCSASPSIASTQLGSLRSAAVRAMAGEPRQPASSVFGRLVKVLIPGRAGSAPIGAPEASLQRTSHPRSNALHQHDFSGGGAKGIGQSACAVRLDSRAGQHGTTRRAAHTAAKSSPHPPDFRPSCAAVRGPVFLPSADKLVPAQNKACREHRRTKVIH